MATIYKILDGVVVSSNVADGANAVAHEFNTENTLSTAGSKIFSWKNNGTELAYLDYAGDVYTASGSYTSGIPDGGGSAIAFHFDTVNTISDNGNNLLQVDNNGVKQFSITPSGGFVIESGGLIFHKGGLIRSGVADGSGSNAIVIETQNTYSTDGANLLQLKNSTNAVMNFSYQGGIDHVNSGASTTSHSQSLNLNWVSTGANAASGQYSAVIGNGNRASATSAVAFGQGNQCTANYAYANGAWNQVSGVSGSAFGNSCFVNNNYSTAFGLECIISNDATLGWSGGKITTAGDAQAMSGCLRIATTDATPTVMKANGTNYVIPADTTWAFSALVAARSDETDGNVSAAWRLEGCMKRDEANNTALVGTITKTILAADTDAQSWNVGIVANDTNESLDVQVVGQAATNIHWSCKLDISQVSFV